MSAESQGGRDMLKSILALIIFWGYNSFSLQAVDHYVVPPGTPGVVSTPDYTNWLTAATSIQNAVDSAATGETIFVTNGNYLLTNQILIAKAVIIRSFHDGAIDRTNTVINGNYPNVTNRCFYINNVTSLIAGFTISNGYSPTGGAVYIYSKGTVSNCLIADSVAINKGGGICYDNGGTVADCLIYNNVSSNYGGGIYGYGTLKNCLVFNNRAVVKGGGISWVQGTAVDCVVSNNVVSNSLSMNTFGGGIYIVNSGSFVSNCVIRNNSAYASGGGAAAAGGGVAMNGGVLRNCLLAYNYSSFLAGGVGREGEVTVQNCTIVSNISASYAGGVAGGKYDNSIIYFNRASGGGGSNYYDWASAGVYCTNCCVAPTNIGALGGLYLAAGSVNNVEQNPAFVDAASGNYRLSVNSPCLNAGTNESWMTNALDLDGRQRIRYGIVDIGAYEIIYNGTIYSIP